MSVPNEPPPAASALASTLDVLQSALTQPGRGTLRPGGSASPPGGLNIRLRSVRPAERRYVYDGFDRIFKPLGDGRDPGGV